MYIKEMNIVGFRNFSKGNNLEVGQNMNIIISKNNVGKSNFGDLISILFSNLNNLWIDNFKEINLIEKESKILFSYKRTPREGGYEEGASKDNVEDSEEKKIEIILEDRNDSRKKIRIVCTSLDETYSRYQDNQFEIELFNDLGVLKEINENIKAIISDIKNDGSGHRKNKEYLFDFLRGSKKEEVYKYNIPIIEKIGYGEPNNEQIRNYIELLTSLAEGKDINKKFLKAKEEIAKKFSNVLDLKDRNFTLEILKREVGSLHSPKYEIYFNEGQMVDGYPYFRYSLDKASKGMKRKLVLVLFLCLWEMIDNEKEIIFFIDEPEQNLHLTAIRKIIEEIKKLNEEKSVQVFISTHSTEIINESNVLDIIFGKINTEDGKNEKEFSTVKLWGLFKKGGSSKINDQNDILGQLKDLGLQIKNRNFLLVEGETDEILFNKIKNVYNNGLEKEKKKNIIIQSVDGLGQYDEQQKGKLEYIKEMNELKKKYNRKGKGFFYIFEGNVCSFGMVIDGDYKNREGMGFSLSSEEIKGQLLILDGISIQDQKIEVYTLEYWLILEIIAAVKKEKGNVIVALNKYFGENGSSKIVINKKEKRIEYEFKRDGDTKSIKKDIEIEDVISGLKKMKDEYAKQGDKFDVFLKNYGKYDDYFIVFMKDIIKRNNKKNSHFIKFIESLEDKALKQTEIYKKIKKVIDNVTN